MFWCLLNLHWEELVRLFLSDLTSNFPWSVSLYNSSIWRPTNQCLMKYFFIGKVHFHKSMALSTNTRILDFWCEFISILSTPIVSWNFYKVMLFLGFGENFPKEKTSSGKILSSGSFSQYQSQYFRLSFIVLLCF